MTHPPNLHRSVCQFVAIYFAFTLMQLPAQPPSPSTPSPQRIHWAGYALSEVRTLRQLPSGLQALLGVGTPGMDGIADRNGKYNSTDVVDPHLPMRRFLIAGLDANTTLIAIEQGGRAWRAEVLLFKNTTLEQTWTLFKPPQTLRELPAQLPLKPSPQITASPASSR